MSLIKLFLVGNIPPNILVPNQKFLNSAAFLTMKSLISDILDSCLGMGMIYIIIFTVYIQDNYHHDNYCIITSYIKTNNVKLKKVYVYDLNKLVFTL